MQSKPSNLVAVLSYPMLCEASMKTFHGLRNKNPVGKKRKSKNEAEHNKCGIFDAAVLIKIKLSV